MDTLSRITFLQIPRTRALYRFPTTFPTTSTPLVSVLRAASSSVSHADEDVLEMFFKERELNGDFISRASDILWQRKLKSYIDSDDIGKFTNNTSQQDISVFFPQAEEGNIASICGYWTGL